MTVRRRWPVAQVWEHAATGVPARRGVVLRTSIVLDRDTPARDRLSTLVRSWLGGRSGDARQWFSWLHLEDWLGVVRWTLGEPTPVRGCTGVAPTRQIPTPAGVPLATAPNLARNRELMAALRRVLHRPPAPPTPAPLVRLGAVVLGTDAALARTGRRAVPAGLSSAGFAFTHPHLGGVLADLLCARRRH